MLDARQSKRLSGSATTLEGWWDMATQQRVMIVRYHTTAIVKFYQDGSILLNHGGWQTATTLRKMNACLVNHRVWQHRGTWYVTALPGRWPEHVSVDGQQIGYGWRAPKRDTPGQTGGMPFVQTQVLICPNHGTVARGTPLALRSEFMPYWRGN